jgi:hypothetical protein
VGNFEYLEFRFSYRACQYFIDARLHIPTIMAELSRPAPGVGGGVARPGAGWAYVAQTQIDGMSGWACGAYKKCYLSLNHKRVNIYYCELFIAILQEKL